MTARLIFEATLIELSKIQAPSLKLHEFNYLFNKAINLYINKVYNIYDINQLTTDDLRVLKSTAYLDPSKVNGAAVGESRGATEIKVNGESDYRKASNYLSRAHSSILSLNGATYEVFMPLDYLHILNCICVYYVAQQKDCWDAGTYIQVPATRLTADSWSQILTDIYNRPSPMKPYYYINNVNLSTTLPTNPYDISTGTGTDVSEPHKATNVNGTGEGDTPNFKRTFTLGNDPNQSLVEKNSAVRIGNASNVRCEIRYGWDDSVFQLVEVQVDYVKVPQHIRLTQEQIDLTADTSQIMEFPDYVNQEIINELVHLVMERTSDPRLNTNVLISLSIARPTQQLQTAELA